MRNVAVKRDKLFMAIARLNLSQRGFALKIGISPNYFSMLKKPETHNSFPSPILRQKILDGFDGKYKFDDLFYLYKNEQESSEIIKS